MHCQFLSHVFKALLKNQNSPKMKLFLQKKCKIFERWGRSPLTLVPSAAGGFASRPQNTPPLRISGYAPGSHKGYVLFVCCRPASNSGQKVGLSLCEDLFFFFFFCSSPDFGQKLGLNLGGTISCSDVCSSQIFWSFCPPFSKSCVRYCL